MRRIPQNLEGYRRNWWEDLLLRRLWKRLRQLVWTPSARWGAGILVGAGICVGLVFWGIFSVTLDYTNSTEFCITCHEMHDNVYEEYKKTVHFQNTSGVRAGCADCHVAKSLGPKLLAKVKASKDVWGHLTGVINTREKFENYRLTMAERVWKHMESTDSRECRSCHSFAAMTVDQQKGDAQKMHPTAIKDGETCISCHKGIAHTMPDMSSGYKKLFEDMQALAAGDTKADILYPIQEVAIYATSDMGSTGGTILPATKLTVLERSGEGLRVRIDGWQQEGVRSAIYSHMGKRVFQAALRGDLVESIKASETMIDPDTDIVWHKVSVDGWVKKNALIDDLDRIWNYGSELYVATCNSCHKAPAADHNLANQWPGILDAMKRFVAVDDKQFRFLRKYLQLHASDIERQAH